MTLDPKALEAAENTPITVDAMLGIIRTAGQILGSRDEMRKVLERAFDAADLVPREENEATVNCLLRERNAAERERDEARRRTQEMIAERDHLLDELTEARKQILGLEDEDETRGAQVAALREALGWALTYAGPAVEGSENYKPVRKKLAQARATLTNTAEAAAQYQRVPEGYVVVPNRERMEEWARKLNTAAPKAGEPEGE